MFFILSPQVQNYSHFLEHSVYSKSNKIYNCNHFARPKYGSQKLFQILTMNVEGSHILRLLVAYARGMSENIPSDNLSIEADDTG